VSRPAGALTSLREFSRLFQRLGFSSPRLSADLSQKRGFFEAPFFTQVSQAFFALFGPRDRIFPRAIWRGPFL